ncbi:hypothetical protein C8Q75DRAFT_805834 [Abortiporus biennis]|nr:hypothetical protein C8Q75DRAFT_805834 [Abortiporus biennis]
MSSYASRTGQNELEDTSRVPTPTASSHPIATTTNTLDVVHPPSHHNPDETVDALSTPTPSTANVAAALSHTAPASPPKTSIPPEAATTSPQRLLPVPTPSANRSRTSFALPDPNTEDVLVSLDSLPAEIANADISIAPDGSFVETSSGQAARELKRRYDQYLGVGKDVRSPYAITAFVNQHGRQMYRVGEMTAPAAAAAQDADAASTRTKSLNAPSTVGHGGKRRSRMSVHSILPQTMFKNGSSSAQPYRQPAIEDGTRSPPVRKLKKARSNPNLSDGSITPAPQPPVPTGRPHAHSVSSADAFRVSIPPVPIPAPPEPAIDSPQNDILSDVLTWHVVPVSPFSSRSVLRHEGGLAISETAPDLIAHPFGHGVSFESPSWRTPSLLSSSPQLREMQSFESGLTARADPQPRSSRYGKLRARLSDLSDEVSPSPSINERPELSSSSDTSLTEPEENRVFTPAAEPCTLTRYSTDIFDVLQHSRGLPSLDKLETNTTVRLSLKSEDSVAPRNDPRFVIWGEVEQEETDDISLSHASVTDLSSGHSGISRRRSTKRHTVAVPDRPFVRITSGEGAKKVIVAATIERWIAQLTSDFNYDELLIFFLTYRTYISPLDLGHLLICRFHWALSQANSAQDEVVRRIVRVRTFTAIRYWLLTFFSVDFVPNRDLRLLFAEWLNSLRKDPILERHKDAQSIVRKLRKVVLDCKDAHMRKSGKPVSTSMDRPGALPASLGDLSNGHFAEALRKAVGKDVEDADIDLDFDEGGRQDTTSIFLDSSSKNPSNPVDLAMLKQPLHFGLMQGTQKVTGTIPTTIPPPVPLPVAHSTISRVWVNTMGRIGRWRRVLNSRTARAPIGACVDVSAFDVEANETGDLLMVRGGVEQYLKMVESQLSQPDLNTHQTPQGPPADQISPVQIPPVPAHPNVTSEASGSDLPPPPVYEEAISSPDVHHAGNDATVAVLDSSSRNSTVADSLSVPDMTVGSTTLASSSRSAFSRSPASFDASSTRRRWQLDVVSIDDLDLSDMSSNEGDDDPRPAHPPGLKKLPRRLPNRRDFEFVRQSIDSVSSMGIRTHDSVVSTGSSSVLSATSGNQGAELGAIQQWQMNALVDSLSDEEEGGDAEAALRRLEGQINRDKQQAKQSKVDGWVQSIRERVANGQFGGGHSRYSSDEEEYGEVLTRSSSRPLSRNSVSRVSHVSSRSSVNSVISPQSQSSAHPATESLPASDPPPPSQEVAPASLDIKPAPEDVVPVEILQSRVPSRPSTSAGSPPSMPPPSVGRPFNTFSMATKGRNDAPKPHKSFITEYRSESLIQHFSMIDRELILGLNWEEFVAQDWALSAEESHVLDWSEFLRERARMKAEGRVGYKTSNLTLIRGRFNLMANFVVSEIVLTHPSERAAVKAKFIRMAWKAYNLANFNTLVAIMAGLRSTWVAKAMKQAPGRVGVWESRLLDDLTIYTTAEGDFKHIRGTIDALSETQKTGPDGSAISTDGQSTTARSRAASEIKQAPPLAACIPFFGVYLSYLTRYSSLPDLIDPTAPNEPVVVDPATGSFDPPSHPEVFSNLAPLPLTVQLEPLINIQKQRLIVDVVKALASGQYLASRVQYPVEKKLFQKCLKLRGLDAATLQRALALY